MTIRSEHHGNIEFRRHGKNERRLTLRECGLIQIFPPEFVFSTGLTTAPNTSTSATPCHRCWAT